MVSSKQEASEQMSRGQTGETTLWKQLLLPSRLVGMQTIIMKASAGLLSIIPGFDRRPELVRSAGKIYFNEDITRDLPKTRTIPEIAERTQALAVQVIV
jgi:hypothetical protein